MELFPPLTVFYEAIAEDPRIGTSHISLYIALLQEWNLNGGVNPIVISRTAIMKAAKINSRYTYSKCMKNLQEFGYVKCVPSCSGTTERVVYLKGL
jgi:replication initiation and membrane attachment protein DnaB